VDWLKKIPVLGALSGEGVKSTEFALLASLVGLVVAKGGDLSLPAAIAIGGCGVGVGLYAIARSKVKVEESKA